MKICYKVTKETFNGIKCPGHIIRLYITGPCDINVWKWTGLLTILQMHNLSLWCKHRQHPLCLKKITKISHQSGFFQGCLICQARRITWLLGTPQVQLHCSLIHSPKQPGPTILPLCSNDRQHKYCQTQTFITLKPLLVGETVTAFNFVLKPFVYQSLLLNLEVWSDIPIAIRFLTSDFSHYRPPAGTWIKHYKQNKTEQSYNDIIIREDDWEFLYRHPEGKEGQPSPNTLYITLRRGQVSHLRMLTPL